MPITLTVNNGEYQFHGTSHQITKDKDALLAPYKKQLWNYGVEIVLQPEPAQADQINRTLGCARTVGNDYLDAREKLYQEEHRILSVGAYKKGGLKALKQEKPFLREVDKFALEAACERMDDAFSHFYGYIREHGAQKKKRGGLKGYPQRLSRFKPNGNSYTTKFTNNNIVLTETHLKLPYLGEVAYRPMDGTRYTDVFPYGARITSVTVRRDGDAYKASLQIERVIDAVEDIRTFYIDRVYGGDAGIKDFLIFGSRESVGKVPNPRHLEIRSKRLRRLQKGMSRKQYDEKTHRGSSNWKKAKAKVAREMRKVADMRRDFLQKLSSRIAGECDVFIREDLNIRGMLKNHHLARAISSVGWGTFFTYLKYKLERRGGCVVKIGRFFPSSKLCNCCGYKNTGLRLKDREWTCPSCGTKHDRDINAKDNILEEGLRVLAETGYRIIGRDGSPVSIRPRLAA